MPVFRKDGLTFHYVDSGAGLPFVFQHGIGGDVRQPTGLFTPPAGVRLLSFDARAHGRTVPMCDPSELRFDVLADDLVAMLNYLEVPRAVVGGISMGAAIALNVAVRYPGRVAGLVLSRPAWPMADDVVEVFDRVAWLLRTSPRDAAPRRLEQEPAFVALAERSADSAASLRTQVQEARALAAVARLERLPRDLPVAHVSDLKSIRVPTLVLAQHCDPLHPFELAAKLVRAISGARLAVLTPKSVDPARHAADVQRAVARFLAQLAEGRSTQGGKPQLTRSATTQVSRSSTAS
jgi:pimeloyl-ACP methyl ester carboxylesterase